MNIHTDTWDFLHRISSLVYVDASPGCNKIGFTIGEETGVQRQFTDTIFTECFMIKPYFAGNGTSKYDR